MAPAVLRPLRLISEHRHALMLPLLALQSSECPPATTPSLQSPHHGTTPFVLLTVTEKKTRKSDLGPEGVSDSASTNQQSGKNQSELILLSKSSSGHLVPEELGKNYSSPDAIDFNWNKQPVHSMVLPRQFPDEIIHIK